ncbi:Tungsten-containing aldehyde:ferredoxin oxidoreductase [Desulfosporosinus sp. I2]|uniref:aldehyde ferredoxin oxidoreductase family protein n=1 Tax=Desulfosporosinus sp. I2 TaxID=1617025 RepID=UPI0005ED888E|nr:aldehyde ferredoxin oxidoreductase family protein [Desulfosporosinus sp. I2]KJR48066.1 Tungsten-containing aldehyde:ferredoxin oxidoreductase [Desulfosporosinus sp. I2]
MNGFTGKVLRVDLTLRKVTVEIPPEEWYIKYLGGKGMGYRYLLEDLAPHTDPLGPDNEIIFMAGPFAGTIIPTSSRMAVMTKSPATGTILVSLVGGGVAAELKYAGYDGIIVMGKASNPVFLYVTDKRVTFENASQLWGKGIHETENIIRKKTWTANAKTLTIGPGGENLVPYACITVDAYHQAGRGGAGAVMGSKNLKAIAIKGTTGNKVDNMPEFLEYIRDIRDNDVLTEPNLWVDTDGTPMIVDLSQEVGFLPTRNFQEGQYDKAAHINSDAVKKKQKKTRACTTCPLGCGRLTQADDGTMVEGPEYETIALAGSNTDIASIDGLIRYNKICDDLGLDTMSTGAVLAYAMEATEKGLHDFGIRFGEEEKMLEYVKKIAYREEIGAELALGLKKLATKTGTESISLEVKGLEFPGYDPRRSNGLALAYATSDRGACHQRAFAAEEDTFGQMDSFTFVGKAAVVKRIQDFNSAKDSLVICDMWRPTLEVLAKLFTRVTNLPMTGKELMNCGERIWNIGRLFNTREGFTRADDSLPPRILNEKLKNGPAKDQIFNKDEFKLSLSEYYALRGWDEDGNVDQNTLERLGMDVALYSKVRGDRT